MLSKYMKLGDCRFARYTLTLLLLQLWALPATAADTCNSLWNVNGSTACVIADGDRLQIRYAQPRSGLVAYGVTQGRLLFDGVRTGIVITGIAFVFARRCPAGLRYQVRGRITENDRRIVFAGQTPRSHDADCRPSHFYRGEVRLDHLRDIEPAPAAAVAQIVPPRDARLERNIVACERHEANACRLALAHADITPEERRHLAMVLGVVQAAAAEAVRSQVLREQQVRLAEERQRAARRQAEANVAAQAQLVGDTDACLDGADQAACHQALTHAGLDEALRRRLDDKLARIYADAQTSTPFFAGILETVTAWGVAVLAWPWLDMLPWLIAFVSGAALLPIARWVAAHIVKVLPTSPDSDPPPPAGPLGVPPAATAVSVSRAPAAQRPPDVTIAAARANTIPAIIGALRGFYARWTARPRDTPRALAAMELALAYLDEVRTAASPAVEDTATRRRHLNTLALATKKINSAERADPDAMLELQNKDGSIRRYRLSEMKAEALFLEGLTHHIYDLDRAIPALVKATKLNPHDPRAFYVLGLTHAANMNKGKAVAALRAAVALDPDNLDYRKDLDRVENVTATEIAGYKATRAGERVYDSGVSVVRGGIFVLNIGVVFWNIFAFTWTTITWPMRVVHRTFRFFGLLP